MRILKKDLKHGVVRLRIENPDDLWHLEHVLEHGDLVKSRTLRKTTIKRGEEVEYGKRKPVTLMIKLEKLGRDGGLRLTGPIAEGPEDIQLSSYHTLSIEPGVTLEIHKDWKVYQLKRLEKARVEKIQLFITMIDREHAGFYLLKESGIKDMGSMNPKKYKEAEDFYKAVMENLEKRDFKNMIIAGPGFERESLLNFIREKNPKLAERIFLEHASSARRSGVQEVIRKSANRVLKQTRVAEETQWVEEVLSRIKTGGLVTYGPEETRNAVEAFAVETLLVSDEKVKEFEELMEKVEKGKGSVAVISSDHESGEQFLHLGGIAALLRFRIS